MRAHDSAMYARIRNPNPMISRKNRDRARDYLSFFVSSSASNA